MTEEMCKDCPWKSRETCGVCKRDRDREDWDKKQDVNPPKK